MTEEEIDTKASDYVASIYENGRNRDGLYERRQVEAALKAGFYSALEWHRAKSGDLPPDDVKVLICYDKIFCIGCYNYEFKEWRVDEGKLRIKDIYWKEFVLPEEM